MTLNRKGRARQKFLPLAPVSPEIVPDNVNRSEWLDTLSQEFVSPSDANKSYYRVLLETLWPPDHGIPGPLIREDQLREAVDQFRRSQHTASTPYKPYIDVFRRLRELQGEEGVTGIGRSGKTYQLVSLTLGKKRVPRVKLSEADWTGILENYQYRCAVCSRSEPEVRFQQDHRIPRTRGGDNQLNNWQPLCDECNNFKSTSCRGCTLDCLQCSWAFPEHFAPLRLSSQNIYRIRQRAATNGLDPHILLNQVVDRFFKSDITDEHEED